MHTTGEFPTNPWLERMATWLLAAQAPRNGSRSRQCENKRELDGSVDGPQAQSRTAKESGCQVHMCGLHLSRSHERHWFPNFHSIDGAFEMQFNFQWDFTNRHPQFLQSEIGDSK